MVVILVFLAGFGAGYLTNNAPADSSGPAISTAHTPVVINPNPALLQSMSIYHSAFNNCKDMLKEEVEANEELKEELRKKSMTY